jgi:hypothetical protein
MLDGSISTGSYAFVSLFVQYCARANDTYRDGLTDNSGARRRAIHEARAHRAHPDFPSDGRIRPSGMGLSWIRARRYRLIYYTTSHAHLLYHLKSVPVLHPPNNA